MKHGWIWFVALLTACGGGDDDDDDDDGDDDDDDADAAVDAAELPDAPPANLCDITREQGDVGEITAAIRRAQGPTPGAFTIYTHVDLDDDGGDLPDVLFLELWDAWGVFAGGDVAPGEYDLDNALESNFWDCGVCAYAYADLDDQGTDDPDDDVYARSFMANRGTVVLDSVDGELVGSFTELNLRQVTIGAPGVQTDVESGCVTEIASGSWDAKIVDE